jgi:hypothetical protein
MKFLLASLKTLTNSINCSENRIKFLFRLSFAIIGTFIAGFRNNFQDYGTTFRDTGGYQKFRNKLLERGLLEGISQLVSVFIEAARNFNLDFLYKKTMKTISAHSKSTVSTFRTFKKKSSSDNIPFSSPLFIANKIFPA